ncbi:MAG: hypothetical protein OHK0044_05710 [Burkholderiaceae bacterium]
MHDDAVAICTEQTTALGSRCWRWLDRDGTPLGFVVIDRIVAGRSCGGIRAGTAVTAEELARIARVMTLKCGYAGLASGGAKGGVIVPSHFSEQQRTARLDAFGRAAADLLSSGVWSHGADMGTTELDIARIRHAAGLGPAPASTWAAPVESERSFSSGTAAGMTAALAAEAALESLGVPLHGARVAVQGAGAVGRAAMTMLAAAGARLVALSTVAGALHAPDGLDVHSVLERLRSATGEALPGMARPDTLFEVPCDALLLCAGSDTLDLAAAERVRARTVVCAANIPFVDEVAQRLEARGVMVVPDFVAGAGGIIGSTFAAVAGITRSELQAMLRRRFKVQVARTIERARAEGTTLAGAARRCAERVLDACEAAYGGDRSPTLLADRLALPEPFLLRRLLAVEERARGSARLAFLARRLHGLAVSRAERVWSAALTKALAE